MSYRKFKEYIETKNEESLRNELITLYKTFEAVEEYYETRLATKKLDEIAQKYKAVLEKQFYPSKGFPKLRYSVARKAISDFKKVCSNPFAIVDMQLTYVEYGVECTLQYGDIDENFYDSMGSMFKTCLENMKENGLLDSFQERCRLIREKTRDMGWGFGDEIRSLYEEYFEAL